VQVFRTSDDRAEYLHGLGAQVVVGDFLDFQSIQKVVAGISTVYFAYPVQHGLLDATVNMAVAARNAGVKRLIDMVMLVSAPDAPTPRLRENYLSEQVFEWAGIGAAHVRATVFFENIRSLANAAIASGVFMAPFGDESTVIPLIAGDDVARVAAAVLTAADVPAGNSYSVIGQVLTVKEIVAAMARGLGREVAYQDVSDEAWAEAASSRINATLSRTCPSCGPPSAPVRCSMRSRTPSRSWAAASRRRSPNSWPTRSSPSRRREEADGTPNQGKPSRTQATAALLTRPIAPNPAYLVCPP
jgi:uncharacterized protein YbjT (DUF2867 family)